MTRLLFAFSVALLTSMFLCSCSIEKENVVGSNSPAFRSTAVTSSAHPALVFRRSVPVAHHSSTVFTTVAVMDTDGTHQTDIYTASSYDAGGYPVGVGWHCWSPTGGSVAWVENYRTIKAIDVSINSHGEPVGSNLRTLYTSPDTINGLAWCSQAATGKLAYVTARYIPNSGPTGSLYTIAQSGGTPTMLASVVDSAMRSPTWSPDDSRIGLLVNRAYPIPYSCHLEALNASTGGLLEDDPLTSYAVVFSCEWARSGNTIILSPVAANGTHYIAYIDYGAGIGPYTQNVIGEYPTWSPNNATILFKNYSAGSLQKINAFGTSVTTAVSNVDDNLVKWKR